MTRVSFAVSIIVGLATNPATAQISPPPKGTARVPIDYVITTDRTFPDYVIVVEIGARADWSFRVDLDPTKPIRISGQGRIGRAAICSLRAIPVESARQFQSDEDLIVAEIDRKLKGVLNCRDESFQPFLDVDDTDAPMRIERRYRILRITPEEGIVLTIDQVADAKADGRAPGSLVRWVLVMAVVVGLSLWFVGRRKAQTSLRGA